MRVEVTFSILKVVLKLTDSMNISQPKSELANATNKRILWDILKDNNVFDRLQNFQYPEVKRTFDSVVLNTSSQIESSMNNYSTVEKNKILIEHLIPAIDSIRKNTPNSHLPSAPTMKVIYDANNIGKINQPFHIKKSEQSEYNTEQYNIQKRERDLTLEANVPSDIDFKDKSLENDKPIGEDMDRLIAERLSARERELSLLPPPPPSISSNKNDDDDKGDITRKKEYRKNVSFSSSIELVQPQDGNINPNINDEFVSNTSFGKIHSKLKLKRNGTSESVRGGNQTNDFSDTNTKFQITEKQYIELMEKIRTLEDKIDILENKNQSENISVGDVTSSPLNPH